MFEIDLCKKDTECEGHGSTLKSTVYSNELEIPHLSFEQAGVAHRTLHTGKFMIQAKSSTEFSDTSLWLEPKVVLDAIGHLS